MIEFMPGAMTEARASGRHTNPLLRGITKRVHSQCDGRTCYPAEIEAYSPNEAAIKRNAPPFWTGAFTDETGAGDAPAIDR